MAGSSATVVVLFAVLEGLGAKSARRPSPEDVSVLVRAVSHEGGELVKQLSDGVMAVFRSPADAVSCALVMRRSMSEPPGQGAALRVGLSVGEPLAEGGDYFGTPVVIARRLCDRAERGQILCASMIGRFESVRQRASLRSLGLLELKGIGAPVSASEVLDPDG